MLKVQFKEKTKMIFCYEELKIGDVFLDELNYICIKVLPDECLRFDGEGWDTALINEAEEVKPIKATLTVEE